MTSTNDQAQALRMNMQFTLHGGSAAQAPDLATARSVSRQQAHEYVLTSLNASYDTCPQLGSVAELVDVAVNGMPDMLEELSCMSCALSDSWHTGSHAGLRS